MNLSERYAVSGGVAAIGGPKTPLAPCVTAGGGCTLEVGLPSTGQRVGMTDCVGGSREDTGGDC